MKLITLTKGYTTQVDDEDFLTLSKYSWSVHVTKHNKYAKTCIDGVTFLLHRFLLNPNPTQEVDHIDRDGLNNQRSNLRLCTSMENKWNTKVRIDNKQGYKGVYFNTKEKKYYAMIKPPEEDRLFLGSFSSPEEAARAYNVAAEQLFGEFAYLNLINDGHSI